MTPKTTQRGLAGAIVLGIPLVVLGTLLLTGQATRAEAEVAAAAAAQSAAAQARPAAPAQAPAHTPPQAPAQAPAATSAPERQEGSVAPHATPAPRVPAPVDFFHPDHQPDKNGILPALPEPAYGGRAVIHLEALPKSFAYALEGSGYTRRILYEINETLLLEDWDTLEWKPDLARSWKVEDQVFLKDRDGKPSKAALIGLVHESDDRLQLSIHAPDGTVTHASFERSRAASIERGTVFTFELRDDVKWHDGHPFDARDVWFSWSLFQQPKVECGEKRSQYQKIVRAEILGLRTIRFTYERQYFNAQRLIGDLPIVPSHLYDLEDPDNATYDPEYHAKRKREDPGWKPDEAERAAYVNQNPHNREWIGLGPYQIVRSDSEGVEARRFPGYFDRSRAGYLDTIVWRHVKDSKSAFQALVAGELDYMNTLTTEDFVGETASKPLFTDRFYKGTYDSYVYTYVAWNLQRPQLADVRVREALARSFDFEGFRRDFYKSLGEQVTGPFPRLSPAYDPAVLPLPYAPARASELLADAGWYDRDGDGVADQDGVPLAIELAILAGNEAALRWGTKLQEDFARVGVRLELRPLEFGVMRERALGHELDAVSFAWVLPAESDPEQVWHSKNARVRSTNYPGIADAEVDRLIEAGQRELDPGKRAAIWRALHARIYALQPYLFGYSPLRKFAMSRALRGLQCVTLDPNYVVRRWYYPKGTPGTRDTPELPRSAEHEGR